MPVRSFNSAVEDVPTTAKFIPAVVAAVGCLRHSALINQPCYSLEAHDPSLPQREGVCNSRAKRAGMNGSINPSSLIRKTVFRGYNAA